MSIHRLTLVILTVFASGIDLAQDDPVTTRMNKYDVEHYDLTITFDLQTKSFRGTVGITATAIQPLDTCILLATKATLTIDSILSGNNRRNFHQDSDDVVIALPVAVPPESSLTLTIFYHGISKFKGAFDDGGVLFTGDNHVATISEPSYAHSWWPCKDLPSDKATASVTVTVPDSLTAASNGILKKVERVNGLATYFWETSYPIATYLVSVAAAPYNEWTDAYIGLNGEQMPIYYYAFPTDEEKAKKDFQNTPKILEFFAKTFGEYPFIKEKFGMAEVDGELTMENQTICSIQKNEICGDQRFELTFAHETAHHWFGDLITPVDWHHTWLNEGFATYCEALYKEHRDGHEAYQKYIASMMSMPPGFYAGSVIGKSDTAFWDSFAPRVYYKGAIVLHMLREMMGDSMFFAALRNYVNNPTLRYANARTDDFVRECENVYGKKLDWFFDQWLYASADSIDRPELQYEWKTVGENHGYSIILSIEQTTASEILYRLPLTVAVRTQSGTHAFDIVDESAEQSFTFSVPEKPTALEIDPDNKVFKFLK